MIKKVLPFLGIVLVAIVIVSTGAFTSVTADRDATINVADDASALLALEPTTTSNGLYAIQDPATNKLKINFDAIGASGVNVDAMTIMNDVFTITNNGTQAVDVTIDWSLSVSTTNVHPTKVQLKGSPFGTDVSSVTGQTSCSIPNLGVGDVAYVSIAVDSNTLSSSDTIIGMIRISATPGSGPPTSPPPASPFL